MLLFLCLIQYKIIPCKLTFQKFTTRNEENSWCHNEELQISWRMSRCSALSAHFILRLFLERGRSTFLLFSWRVHIYLHFEEQVNSWFLVWNNGVLSQSWICYDLSLFNTSSIYTYEHLCSSLTRINNYYPINATGRLKFTVI